MDIINEFGIKPILLAAQIVNFLILLFLLKRFLYKPIQKVLENRQQKIAESLQNAETIEKKLATITSERELKLEETSREVKQILQDASASAGQIIAEAHAKAALDIEKQLKRSRDEIAKERAEMYQQVKIEIAGMIAKSLEKIVGKVLNKGDHQRLIEESINSLNN